MSAYDEWRDKEMTRLCYENGWIKSLLERVRVSADPALAEEIDRSLESLAQMLKEREDAA